MGTKKPAPRAPEVVIEWYDARSWNYDTLPRESVPQRVGLAVRLCKGWLVYEGPDLHGVPVHVLAATFDPPETPEDEPEYGDFIVIPTGWIRAVRGRRSCSRRRAASPAPAAQGEDAGPAAVDGAPGRVLGRSHA